MQAVLDAPSKQKTVQMNTRIPEGLKVEGDEVLRELGYTPSQAVRAFYEYLVAHRSEPSSNLHLLTRENIKEEQEQKKNSLQKHYLQLQDQLQTFYREHNIHPNEQKIESYNEREEYTDEIFNRLRERSLA